LFGWQDKMWLGLRGEEWIWRNGDLFDFMVKLPL
jgi:hypothetical protein